MTAPSTPSTINFIQAQPFALSGSGASIGDVTITLQSMVGIDGTNIVTADLGSFAYGTLEPGNGTQEEAIIFTGVTQNANGTATLTGVSSVAFKQPYTLTTGITKTHAGNSKFILSNDAAFYNNFTLYLNSIAGAGAANASTAVKGIVQAATLAQVNSQTPTGSTGAILVVTPDVLVNSFSTGRGMVQLATSAQINAGTATGSSGASLAVTPDQLALSNYGTSFFKLGETILGSSATALAVSGLSSVNNLLIFVQTAGFDSADVPCIRYNNDSTTNYSYRISDNNAADSVSTGRTLVQLNGSIIGGTSSYVIETLNKTSLVKQMLVRGARDGTASAAPTRSDVAGVWGNTTTPATGVTIVSLNGNNFLTGTRLTVYGA